MIRAIQIVCVAVVVAALGSMAVAKVDIETVRVGDPGNAGEQSRLASDGDKTHYGGVAYTYNIGKYEVTAGQYTDFLNNVAGVDPYGLYNTSMTGNYGCKIQRTGSSGSYSYSVAGDYANRPVNYVSWGDSARFVNWLHNGQPAGTLTGDPAQDAGLTEDGSYHLYGATTFMGLLGVHRQDDWKWAITSEDEWYKAAYYKGGGTSAGYWDYPTSNDSVPANDLIEPTDPGNNATFYDDGYTVGAYYRTEAGAHENSDSPYGTFDQGGNLFEWNEAILGSSRGIRGGSFVSNDNQLLTSFRYGYLPTDRREILGFRVVEVPEPATLSLLALGGLAVLRGRRKQQTAAVSRRANVIFIQGALK